MADLLNVIKLPDPRLRQKASPVEYFDSALKGFVESMAETMYFNQGIGLAAVQVADFRRLLVLDIAGMDAKKTSASSEDEVEDFVEKKSEQRKKKLEYYINPIILERDGDIEYEEGCLSIPGIYANVERNERLRIKYQDLSGKEIEMETHGLRSIVLQHEIDHLDGILFIDHIGPAQRMRLLEKYQKLQLEANKEKSKK